jgi:hypothetical protein
MPDDILPPFPHPLGLLAKTGTVQCRTGSNVRRI